MNSNKSDEGTEASAAEGLGEICLEELAKNLQTDFTKEIGRAHV